MVVWQAGGFWFGDLLPLELAVVVVHPPPLGLGGGIGCTKNLNQPPIIRRLPLHGRALWLEFCYIWG